MNPFKQALSRKGIPFKNAFNNNMNPFSKGLKKGKDSL